MVYDFKVLDLDDYFEDPASEQLEYSARLERRSLGLVNCIAAGAYHFCLALHAAFSQPGVCILAEPCIRIRTNLSRGPSVVGPRLL